MKSFIFVILKNFFKVLNLKLKYFTSNGSSHQDMLTEIERKLDLWQSKHPEVKIKRTYLTPIPENDKIYGSLVLGVEYVEIFKKDLIIETNAE